MLLLLLLLVLGILVPTPPLSRDKEDAANPDVETDPAECTGLGDNSSTPARR